MSAEIILENEIGAIEAPAGCGKTQLIVEVLAIPTIKPYLVLTHTNAGVTALRKRLTRARVPAKKYIRCIFIEIDFSENTFDVWEYKLCSCAWPAGPGP